MSDPITVTVVVSPAYAAAQGCDSAGTIQLVMRPSELSEGARAILAIMVQQRHMLDASSGWVVTPEARIFAVQPRPGIHFDATPVPLPITSQSLAALCEDAAAQRAAETAAIAATKALEATETRTSIAAWLGSDGTLQAGEDLWWRAHSCLPVDDPVRVAYTAQIGDMRAVERARAEFESQQAAAVRMEREQAADAAREAVLGEWIILYATDAQRRRHARGLLPRDEILAGLRNQTFAALDHLPRYQRLDDAEVRRLTGSEGEVSYDVEGAEDCTNAELARIEEIERLLPTCAEAVLREHVGAATDIDGEGQEVRRRSILVTVELAPGLNVSREFAA